MYTKQFSITELEQQVERIEQIEEKIEFISDEILRCERVIQELSYNTINKPLGIKVTTRQNGTAQQLVELLNSDFELNEIVSKKVVKVCNDKICERNKHFLERAKLLLDHYETLLDLQLKKKKLSIEDAEIVKSRNGTGRIVWFLGKDKLIDLFAALYENNILPKYTTKEILVHFANEKRTPYLQNMGVMNKFHWRDSDNSFAVFVDELAKRGAIDDENKYKIFEQHFLSKKGKPFKYLAQKKNYTENFTLTGNLIKQILGPLNF